MLERFLTEIDSHKDE